MPSNEFRSSAFAQETDDIWLILLTLTHTDLDEPIRVARNTENVVSNGQTFVAFPFDIELPNDQEDQSPTARLTISNISREIAETLRSIRSSPSVTIEVVSAEDPDTVEFRLPGFQLKNVGWDAISVQGQLTLENIAVEPFPEGLFTPANFPGLF